jgi:hypothetical protein
MSKSESERGAILATVAVSVLLLLFFLALAIDVGAGYVERRRVQAVADAASLAAAQVLTSNGTDADILAVITEYVLVRNPLAANEQRAYTAQWLEGATVVGTVGVGGRPTRATGVLVTVTGHVPTLIANVLGIRQVGAAAQGGGGYSPLDAMLVIDKSGSMDDDSCFLYSTSSGFSLRTHFKTSGQCLEVSTGDGLSSSNCPNCKGTVHTVGSTWHCDWPGGTLMGSEVTAICGSVQTDKTACTNCSGKWKTPARPIQDLKTAATSFVDMVDTQLGPTSPHMGLVTYSDSATLAVQLTSSLSSVRSGINSIAVSGYTNCEAGLYTARVELTTSGRQRWTAVKVIVFMSDGNANRCRTKPSCSDATAKQLAIAEAQLAGTQGIIVSTIGLGTLADQDMLRQMVANGGAFLYAPTSADLQAVYAEMFQKIKRNRLVR